VKPEPRPLDVRIEELVLDGFAPDDRHGIAEAVERELGRLLPREPHAPQATAERVARAVDEERRP
jgi:hypothetical protein